MPKSDRIRLEREGSWLLQGAPRAGQGEVLPLLLLDPPLAPGELTICEVICLITVYVTKTGSYVMHY